MIKIEVTGNSIPEVADKLIAIGRSLRGDVPPVLVSKTSKQIDAVMPELREAAEQAPADPTPSEAASSGPTEASPTATSGSEPETPTTGEPQEPAAPEIDPTFLRDLVLEVVEKRSKPVMAEILERFGIAKASQVAPEHAAELVAAMHEALGK